MKIFTISCVTFGLLFFSNDNEVYKTYGTGRAMYYMQNLKLYRDSTYSFYAWFHFSGPVRDSGIWKMKDSFLFLNSIQTISQKRKILTKKQYRKHKKFKQSFFEVDSALLFHGDTILVRSNSVVFYQSYYKRNDSASFFFELQELK